MVSLQIKNIGAIRVFGFLSPIPSWMLSQSEARSRVLTPQIAFTVVSPQRGRERWPVCFMMVSHVSDLHNLNSNEKRALAIERKIVERLRPARREGCWRHPS
jgi:hypothetical protein